MKKTWIQTIGVVHDSKNVKNEWKTWKNKLVPPWVTFQSLKTYENGGWRRVEKKKCRWCMLRDLNLVVQSTLPPLFTKLPLLGAELQKCHYWASNVAHSLRWRGNDVEMMWKWCGNSLQLKINVQAPKLLHPNT